MSTCPAAATASKVVGTSPLEHDATEAVMQTRAHLDLLGGGDRRQVGHDDAPLRDGVAHGAVRRQVEHHDAPVLDRLAHGDARRQLERQLALVQCLDARS